MMLAVVCMFIAILSLGYAGYLHIYYHGRVRSLREVEEEKFKEYMRVLGVDDELSNELLKTCSTLKDLQNLNKNLKKSVGKT